MCDFCDEVQYMKKGNKKEPLVGCLRWKPPIVQGIVYYEEPLFDGVATMSFKNLDTEPAVLVEPTLRQILENYKAELIGEIMEILNPPDGSIKTLAKASFDGLKLFKKTDKFTEKFMLKMGLEAGKK